MQCDISNHVTRVVFTREHELEIEDKFMIIITKLYLIQK